MVTRAVMLHQTGAGVNLIMLGNVHAVLRQIRHREGMMGNDSDYRVSFYQDDE